VTRSPARTCTAAATLALALAGSLGVLTESAWAVELPTPSPAPAPVLPQPAHLAPVAAPTLLPAPVASLLPAPVATAVDAVVSGDPGSSPSASPSARPTPAPAPAQPAGEQQARSRTQIEALPAAPALPAMPALRVNEGAAALRALPGVVAPVAVAPEAVTPQLAPVPPNGVASSVPAMLPATPTTQGLPAVVVALAVGAVSAAAGGQVAELAARRRTAKT
jgi:hypothetical protein